MEEALDELAALRREMVPRMGLKNTTRRFNYGWVDAIDILNMLDVCKITIHSSLNRKESRGAFYRTDYPVTDNENWLAKNILRKTEGGLEFRIKPYQTTHIKPDFRQEGRIVGGLVVHSLPKFVSSAQLRGGFGGCTRQ